MVILLLSIISSCLYRLGGAGKTGDKWDFARKSAVRDWVIPLIIILAFLSKGLYHWSLWLCYPLLGAALSSYEYFLPDDPKKTWKNWCLHGFMIALSLIPWCLFMGHWNYFLIRLVILPALITAWTLLCPSPKWDELGRGFFIVATLYFI